MRKIAFSLVSLVTICASAETVYTYEDDGKTVVATVPGGETNELSTAVVGALNDNTYTNFVKRGDGMLLVLDTNAPNTYLGEIHIEEGYYVSRLTQAANPKANYTVGAFEGGAVYVKDGASWRIWASSGVCDSYVNTKKVYFEGRGPNDDAALCIHTASNNQFGKTFGGEMIMTGDALVWNNIHGFGGIPGNAAKLNMQGYTLTFRNRLAGAGSGVYCYCGNGSDATYISQLGDIVAEEGGVNISGSMYWLACAVDAHTFTVTNNANFTINGCWGYNQYKLRLYPGATIYCNGNAAGDSNNPYGCVYSQYGNKLIGSVELLDPVRNSYCANSGNYINENGAMSGGGISVDNGMRLFISNPNNSFTNGVVINGTSRLIVTDAKAVPSAGAPLILNDTAYVHFPSTLQYELPEVICAGLTNTLYGTMGYTYPLDTGDIPNGCQYYTNLTLKGGVVNATTNVLVTALKGFGEFVGDIQELQLRDGSWEFNVSDALDGKSLKVKRFRAMGDVIDTEFIVNLDRVQRGAVSCKIVQTTDFISDVGSKPKITLRGEQADHGTWTITKGADNLSWVLSYIPPGTTIIVK